MGLLACSAFLRGFVRGVMRRGGRRLRSGSQGIKIGAVPPAATISAAKVVSRSPRRSTMASRWPFDAKTRASSVPIPEDAPVISVTRSPMHYAVRGDKGHPQARSRLDRDRPARGPQIRLDSGDEWRPPDALCALREMDQGRGSAASTPWLPTGIR
jgi:hypothetical protein